MDRQETTTLIERARAGSSDALNALYARCAGKLLPLIRLRMGPSLRSELESRDILRTAVVIGIATLIGHLIPLVPFMFLSRTPALVLAIVLSAVALFGVGAYTAVTLVGDWRRSGLKFLAIGLGAAAIGFFVGRLFNATGA